jgi:hypothetical protein
LQPRTQALSSEARSGKSLGMGLVILTKHFPVMNL